MKLKPGNLIKVKSNPASYSSPTGKEPPVNYFFSDMSNENVSFSDEKDNVEYASWVGLVIKL